MKTRRDEFKDDVIWNVEQGLKLTPEQIAHAESPAHTCSIHRMRLFLERYEFLLCPVNQLPPFPAARRVPDSEIAGVLMGNYLDWMKSCYYITVTSHPAISVPAGFTDDARRCRSACRSSGATATISACCSSRTRSNRKPRRGSGAPAWRPLDPVKE